jgi:hypothetical protein
LATTPPGRTGEWIVVGLGGPALMTSVPPTAASADSAATAPIAAGDFAAAPASAPFPASPTLAATMPTRNRPPGCSAWSAPRIARSCPR